MSQPVEAVPPTWSNRLRERLGTRLGALLFALAVELLIVLILLTIAPSIIEREEEVPIRTFGVSPEPEPPAPEQPEPPTKAPQPPAATRPDPQPVDPQVTPDTPAPQPSPPVILPIPLGKMPDIADLPSRPAAPARPRAVAGPPAPGPSPGDTPRVEGRGPNGEPLYAAAWYREPYDSELAGYLSSAKGPGWGRIACRTAPDFRVEDCVALGEYPEGSNIARAVLAAAWQFRVRPPRRGGQVLVGEWVRIHIDYGIRRR